MASGFNFSGSQISILILNLIKIPKFGLFPGCDRDLKISYKFWVQTPKPPKSKNPKKFWKIGIPGVEIRGIPLSRSIM